MMRKFLKRFFLKRKIKRKRKKLLRGLENVTTEEIEKALFEAPTPEKILVRGAEIRPLILLGGVKRRLVKVKEQDLFNHVLRDPKDEARQRAYLLRIAVLGGV